MRMSGSRGAVSVPVAYVRHRKGIAAPVVRHPLSLSVRSYRRRALREARRR
jgi:hypothetical protein